MKTYAIDTGDGSQITVGLPATTAHRIAQQIADERDESVWLYEIPSGANSEEIAPSEIEVNLEGPAGPRVTYGAQYAARVEEEIPEGWKIDWSNAIDISISGTHRIRYAAPLIRVIGEAE